MPEIEKNNMKVNLAIGNHDGEKIEYLPSLGTKE